MSLQSGEQFGRYELVSQLARGGMAETWRARLLGEAGVTKPVLIKKVLPEFATDEEFIAMFISEARISATLSHGNIAQVYDFGRVDGEYFLAMEYVDGQPLNRIMKRASRVGLTSIPIPIACFIAMEMCRGLHYAHTRADSSGRPLGIVHRDISPDNVLVSYEGQVKIVDFGIAKARELRGFNTAPGLVKGKYLFFSPEQAQGEQVDSRTDVWATGIVLYEMLCGRLPVDDLPHIAVPKLSRGQFPRPAGLRPELPPQLDALVMRALEVNRDARYESCHAFGDALAEFLYSTSARFSAVSLSHFMQELYRQDLITSGHQVQVPPSFQEQMAQWRGELTTAPGSSVEHESPGSDSSTLQTEVPAQPAPRKALYLGVGAAAALVGAILTAFVFVHGMEPPPAPSPTAPSPAPEPSEDLALPEDMAPPSEPLPSEPDSPEVMPEPEPAHARASASYPVEAIRLDARKDVISTLTVTEKHALKPGVTYRISEPKPPPSAPPLFFWLSGPQLRAKEGTGVLSQRPSQVKGASELKVFSLDPLPAELPTREVVIESLQPRSRTRIAVPPSALASTEQAFELKNLDPSSTYALDLLPLVEGAYTRGEAGGAIEQLACVRVPAQGAVPTGKETLPAARQQQFLLRGDASISVSGAGSLLCGFIDDEPGDNQGGLKIRITQTGGGRVWTSPSPYTLVMPTKKGELKTAFDEAMRLFSAREFDGAAIFAERCLALDPKDADCQLLAGATYASIPGRVEKAIQHYRTFAIMYPEHPITVQVKRHLVELDQLAHEQAR
jgi:serine/threonine protein kinase